MASERPGYPAREPRAPLVVIDARLTNDGSVGGVAWVIEGLLRGLAGLDGGEERYLVVANREQRASLQTVLNEQMQLLIDPQSPLLRLRSRIRYTVRRFPLMQQARDSLLNRFPRRALQSHAGSRAAHDPLLDSLNADLFHFPSQRYYATSAPTIYNPHDLQHLHHPQFFVRHEHDRRERLYRRACADANRIAVSSQWVKRDLIAQYGTAASKIQVIPWGIEQQQPRLSPPQLAAARRLVGLGPEDAFVLYPASTWEHKNHLRLLDAFAELHQNTPLKLVCCGHKQGFFRVIERRIRALGLDEQVSFPGVIPRSQLDALYAQALFVVIPSLFEASSALLREAWRWRRPVACAAVTSLPEQAGGSALLFDPAKPAAIADAMRCLASDPALREQLVLAGQQRLGRFTWRRTATAYRALYRSALGVALTDEDRALLEDNWMTD